MNTTCADCGGTLRPGSLGARPPGMGKTAVFWIGHAAAQPRRMLGALTGDVDLVPAETEYLVVTYRCERCGLLKAYARSSGSE